MFKKPNDISNPIEGVGSSRKNLSHDIDGESYKNVDQGFIRYISDLDGYGRYKKAMDESGIDPLIIENDKLRDVIREVLSSIDEYLGDVLDELADDIDIPDLNYLRGKVRALHSIKYIINDLIEKGEL